MVGDDSSLFQDDMTVSSSIPNSATGDEDDLFGAVSGDDSNISASPTNIANYQNKSQYQNYSSKNSNFLAPQSAHPQHKYKHPTRSVSDTFLFKVCFFF